MEQLEQKSFTVSRGFTYTYYQKPTPYDGRRPTLLLLHGFPDDHNLWIKIVPYLSKLPYGLLVPDLLGYGGTSKPTDPTMYTSKAMAKDISEILDHEGIEKFVSIGHDFGAYLAGRMWLWYPERIVGIVLLNAAYAPPRPFHLDRLNALLQRATGLPRFAYWEFLTAPDAPRLMRMNIESAYAALHGQRGDEDISCRYGALRDFVENNRRVPLHPYAEDPAIKDSWIARFTRNGFEAPLQWYIAHVRRLHWAVEKELPKERHKITVPLLFIGATRDAGSPTSAIWQPHRAGLLPTLVVKEVESGHWQTLEVPEQTGPLMVSWLQKQDFTLPKSAL